MLSRVLSYNDLLYVSIGNIIGGGAFFLMGRSIKFGGGMTWIYLIVTGFLIYFMSKAYIDVMDKFTDVDSEHEIAKEVGGNTFASLFTLTNVFSCASVIAVLSLAIAKHLKFSFDINYSEMTLAFITILAITAINIIGTRESVTVINTITMIEFGTLLLLSLTLPLNYKTDQLIKKPDSWIKASLVPLIMIFAYTGFETLPKLAGESINPQNDIPKAIDTSILITSTLYVVVCIVMISVLGVSRAQSSDAPMIDTFTSVFGKGITGIITIIALMSIFNTIMVNNISGSRSLYGFGKKHDIPMLNYVNDYTKTPTGSIILTSIVGILILLSIRSIENLAIFANLFVMITLIVINWSALKSSKNNMQSFRNISSIVLALIFLGFGGSQMYYDD